MVTKAVSWTTRDLDPKGILLDVKNPRIEVSDDASQNGIRLRLLETEDVLDLARSIEKSNGLLYGERIITAVENGRQIVLEGNRRVAACQMLLDPSLVPMRYMSRFPVASPSTRVALSRLSADIAPNREVAEPILTKRHTERGVKPWSPVAKMRRAVRLLDRLSVEEVAQLLGTSISQVKKLVRPYRLLKYAFELKGWTESERKALEDEKLKTNPYTRLFTLGVTKEVLQIHFDSDESIVSTLPVKVFEDQMKRIVRDFLIPDPATGRPRCDTRTDPTNYFSAFISSPEGMAAADAGGRKPQSDKPDPKAGSGKPAGGRRPTTPKASVFFENLECHVQDDRLIRLTGEIRGISHVHATIAASLLTRAIFECALVHKLQKTKRWGELIKEEGKDPGLAEIIKFSANFGNGVFAEQNICKTLKSHTTAQAKNYLDAIAHMRYQDADAQALASVANNLRQVIQHILSGN